MKSDDLDKWTNGVWRTLSEFPGSPEFVTTQQRLWEEFQAKAGLRVVVVGPYDAGKSALLKRLLVEAGTVVPEWLIVSGRRETFEVREVNSEGIHFVDTPGLGSGNREHDQIGLEAIKLADAYLWVMPPQLITTGREEFLEILKGSHFCEGLPKSVVAGATIAVIARMDEAGIDPADNLEGFEKLARKKSEELKQLLCEGGVDALRAVWCVAADPYQLVGNTPGADRDSYEVGRDWDRVEDLKQCLRELCDDKNPLRELAGTRFVGAFARQVQQEVAALVDDLELTLEGCTNEIDAHRLCEERLCALKSHARADLRSRVEDALLSASRARSESPAETLRSLESSLSSVVDDWSETFFAEYRRLAADLEFEIRRRMAGPSFAGFRKCVAEAEETEARAGRQGVDAAKIGKRVLGLGPALRQAFDAYASAELGVSLKTAAERLEKTKQSGKVVEATIKAQGQKARFRGTASSDKASKYVKWGRILDAAGPLVEQLGDALFEVVGEVMTARRAEERAQQREELRRKIRVEAHKIEDEAAGDFEATCGGLGEWLDERISIVKEGQLGVEQRLKSLRDFASNLSAALRA
jgi:hypothetical protein